MPLYEYRCTCGAREERLEPLSSPVQHDCPECGSTQGMQRQLSVAAVAVAGGTAPAPGGACATGCCPFAS